MLSETYLGKCNFLKRHYYQKNNPFIKLNYDETCLIASVLFSSKRIARKKIKTLGFESQTHAVKNEMSLNLNSAYDNMRVSRGTKKKQFQWLEL